MKPKETPKSPRIASDYTARAGYMADYRKRNKEAINARKRAWREKHKLFPVPVLAEPESKLALHTPKLACEGEARESKREGNRDPKTDSRGGENNF